MSLPWGLRGMVFRAALEAERTLDRPIRRNDVLIQMKKSSLFVPLPNMVRMILNDLYRNDELLADEECNHYSSRAEMQDTPEHPTGFELFSDRIKRMWPECVLDD